MNYKFPIITDIQQIREAIKGRPEFIELHRGDHIIFNYLVVNEHTFPPIVSEKEAILRECRGLVFDNSGKLISRRFHKFFNLNEREETQSHFIDWNTEHILLEKLDGSMITPLLLSRGLEWATKMGVTDIGMKVKQFINKNLEHDYITFAYDCASCNVTPIFEYIAPDNRIVINYNTEQLILLAIRDNITGDYRSYRKICQAASLYNIPYVQKTKASVLETKELENIEGVVVLFNDGHKIKVKSDWYVRIHKAKENLLFEKNVIKMILEEKTDDIIPMLPEEDKNRLKVYTTELINKIDDHTTKLSLILDNLIKNSSKKEFALNHAGSCSPLYRTIIFSCWDRPENIRQQVIDYILKNTRTQKEVDLIRHYIGVKW